MHASANPKVGSRMKEIKVAYRVVNGGDGSAHPEFYATEAEAQAVEDKEIDEGYDSWAESSIGTLRIYIREELTGQSFFIRGEREFFPKTSTFGPYPYYKLETEEIDNESITNVSRNS